MFGMSRRNFSTLIAVLIVLTLPAAASAHKASPATFDELGSWWVFEPGVVIPLALSLLLYLRGLFRLRSVSPHAFGTYPLACFVTGWLVLVVALVSPLHPWGSVLFSAHMTQHELLMLVAAPLLVLGRPVIPLLWALPRQATRRISAVAKSRCGEARGISSHYRLSRGSFIVVLWTWHVPVLFQATLDREFVHALQHASFLFSALLFWWAILHGRARAVGFGVAVLYIFTTALHSGLLGALLTIAGTVWYPIYDSTTASWGLTPLQDQQLGGLIMWIPAGLVYVIAGLALFAGWLRESEERTNALAPVRKRA